MTLNLSILIFLFLSGCVGRFSLVPEKRKELPQPTSTQLPEFVVSSEEESGDRQSDEATSDDTSLAFNFQDYQKRQLEYAKNLSNYLFLGSCVGFPADARQTLCEDYYYSASELRQTIGVFVEETRMLCESRRDRIWQTKTCIPASATPELVCYEQSEGKKIKLSLRLSTLLDYEDAKTGLKQASELVSARCRI